MAADGGTAISEFAMDADCASFRDVTASGAPAPDMIAPPLGRFQMGAYRRDAYAGDVERPRRGVTLRRPFALARFAVTFDAYDAFVAATGADSPSDEGWGRGRRPVVNVSHRDAIAYCAWLSEETGARYRLPSEAEWEYVCRAGGDARFATGDAISSVDANFNGLSPWPGAEPGPYLDQTAEVGAYAPSAWGFYDLHGNVVEWCADDWFPSHEGRPGTPAPRKSPHPKRRRDDEDTAVVKGGGWSAKALFVRATDRWHYAKDVRLPMIGFRVARDGPAPAVD